MRQSAHSLRLAVSFLLGTVFVVTPMANSAFAAGSNPLITSGAFTPKADQIPCKNILQDSLLGMNAALVPSQFERVDSTLLNKLVITSPKNTTTGSFMPVETVLKKVTSDDLKSDVVITPSPSPELTVSGATTSVDSLNNTQMTQGTNTSNLNADVLFNLVNSTRSSYGLPAFQKNDQICAVAASRAPEIDSEIWVTHTMHAGFYARNLPFWATENLISMSSEQSALNWWLNSPVHRSAILGSWKFACVACSGKSCSMIFSNLEPKYTAPQVIPPTPTLAQTAVGNATTTLTSIGK